MFCPHCGNEVGEGQSFCGRCGGNLAPDLGTGPAGGGRAKTPWEDRGSIGSFRGLSQTLSQVLLRPSEFFSRMPVTGGLSDPLLFGLIVGMIGLSFFHFWDIVFRNHVQSFMTPEMQAIARRSMAEGIASPVGAVMMPFMVMLWIFLVSGMLHVLLLTVRGAKAGFEATFRVISYSVSPFLFMVIPYCGSFITMLWTVVLTIIGLKEAHETSGGKATFAVLFPFLLCCAVIMIAVFLFMGAIAASLGTMLRLSK